VCREAATSPNGGIREGAHEQKGALIEYDAFAGYRMW